ncbi:MAG TPA: hypothetical protein HPP54_08065 [Nitrospinae bacterium]|nr:hypothetical protein [Nitrospinota bacterium]
MNKIVYIHGFGSSYKPDSNKIRIMSGTYEVVGMSYDYTAPADQNLASLTKFAITEKVDMTVGASLGGWYASQLGCNLGVPSVMINPAVNPGITLTKYIGENVDHYGNAYTLTQEVVDSYWDFETKGFGLVLIDAGDEVIDPDSINHVECNYEIKTFEGGNHRFAHMAESMEFIDRHLGESVVMGF